MPPIKNRDFLSKREIKKMGFSIAVGFILSIISAFIFGREGREIGLYASLFGLGIAYFFVSNRIFKE